MLAKLMKASEHYLQGCPRGHYQVLTIWPSDGQRIVCHAAAPREADPTHLDRSCDLENDGEGCRLRLRYSNTECDSSVGGLR